ncbi:MAG: phospho-sugar mutase [Bacillota bacterium]
MNSMECYDFWMGNGYFDAETKAELLAISGNTAEIEERFYRDLEFGTGGLRGILGAGTNRMNLYTVRKASQGVASFVVKQGADAMAAGIAIGYDSRYRSAEFALEAAKVFAQNGVKAYLFDSLRPTPMVSYAVRKLGCAAGVVVTASHNPKEYNGYKVYGEDGGQLSLEGTEIVYAEIEAITDLTTIKVMEEKAAFDKGLIEIMPKFIDDDYIRDLRTLSINPNIASEVPGFKIVYTPIHGAGNIPVRRILAEGGFDVLIVKEQELPDPAFSTVKSPNPENKECFEIAIELAKKEGVDLIIGTDPDSDRVGVSVKRGENDFVMLTGNQTGMLLTEYILSAMRQNGTLPSNGFIVKTIVTTELARKIAAAYDVELVEVLTGFKFIGEQIKCRDEEGNQKYLFGFEESYGYLAGTFARDKDAVVASMLIAEMAAWYKKQGMTLYEGLQAIFEKYGYSIEGIDNFTLKGKEGVEKILATMETLRESAPKAFGEAVVKVIRDYEKKTRTNILTGEVKLMDLPASNVLYYEMVDGSWFCIRPSGTEPKLKIYYGVSEKTLNETEERLKILQKGVLGIINPLLKN